MQRNNRVFTKEYDPEKRRQLLIEATDSKPWRLKLKKKRGERTVSDYVFYW